MRQRVAEERLPVPRVQLRVLSEVGVRLERHIRGKHHKLPGLHVRVLQLPIPVPGLPRERDEVAEVLVIEPQRRPVHLPSYPERTK